MKKYVIFVFLLLAAAPSSQAQAPLYIVNGKECNQISSIPPEDIEKVESLPADEQTIARYGEKAMHGVLLVTLRYDQPATFEADSSFTDYIARNVTWGDDEPAARVIIRYTITPEGNTVIDQALESTDSRLKRRVLKAISDAPSWRPATKDGKPVASDGVLNIQLPQGKRIPRPVELIW